MGIIKIRLHLSKEGIRKGMGEKRVDYREKRGTELGLENEEKKIKKRKLEISDE